MRNPSGTCAGTCVHAQVIYKWLDAPQLYLVVRSLARNWTDEDHEHVDEQGVAMAEQLLKVFGARCRCRREDCTLACVPLHSVTEEFWAVVRLFLHVLGP